MSGEYIGKISATSHAHELGPHAHLHHHSSGDSVLLFHNRVLLSFELPTIWVGISITHITYLVKR